MRMLILKTTPYEGLKRGNDRYFDVSTQSNQLENLDSSERNIPDMTGLLV